MRKAGIDRATAVDSFDDPVYCMRCLGLSLAPSEDKSGSVRTSADVTKEDYQAIAQQEQAKWQREQKDLQKRETESSKEEEQEEVYRPLTPEERAKVLARDPWLAKEWDEKYGVGQWVPVPWFGTECYQSYELYRRERLMEEAREKHPWKLPKMQQHKFDDKFPYAFDPDEYLRLPKPSGWRLRCPGLNEFRLWRYRRRCRRARRLAC